jgi:hypothetical protein
MADGDLFEAGNKLAKAIMIASNNFSTINRLKHLTSRYKKAHSSISRGGFEEVPNELQSPLAFNPDIFKPKNVIKTGFNTGTNNSNYVGS